MTSEDIDYRIETTRDADGDIQSVRITSESHAVTLSDGFHTMEELYDHRRAMTAVLAGAYAAARLTPSHGAWRSKAHHPDDSPMFEGGYFIVGIELYTGTITYHYKLTHWDDFRAVPEVAHAPKWDGAPPSATVDRLLKLARLMGHFAIAASLASPQRGPAPQAVVDPGGDPYKTNWPETARDLISGDQERIDRHLGVVDNRIGPNFGRPIQDRPQA